MGTNQPLMSTEIMSLKEKINLKKLDREVYIHQTDDILKSKMDKRRALRIGNDCLTHMTNKQLNMPKILNANIFANKPNSERLCMQKISLQDSIHVNDSRLFKYGKRLLKQDYIAKQKNATLAKAKRDLDLARVEKRCTKEEYEQRCEEFLHKQVMVEDSRDRELSAKQTYLRLQKILDELNKDLVSIPLRNQQIEKQIMEKKAELQDFTDLRDRAKQYLQVEEEALKPVNMEMASCTKHFESLIYSTRNEVDDRRKNGALLRFLAEREQNPLSFVDTANIMDVQFKRRNKAISAYDMITSLMDATMVSDIDNVVECFLDQTDVTNLLEAEKALHKETNEQLRAKLASVKENNKFLKFDANKSVRNRAEYLKAVEEETKQVKEIEHTDTLLSKQDKLISKTRLAVHALAEKLRPIKLEDLDLTLNGNLINDMQIVLEKMKKMLDIIKNNTVPVGPVRPIMLHLYKEERVPPDSIRVDATDKYHSKSMTTFESFEADSPGLITREMLKQRAANAIAENQKKKGGKNRGRKK